MYTSNILLYSVSFSIMSWSFVYFDYIQHTNNQKYHKRITSFYGSGAYCLTFSLGVSLYGRPPAQGDARSTRPSLPSIDVNPNLTRFETWLCFCYPTTWCKGPGVHSISILSLELYLVSFWLHCFSARNSGLSVRVSDG